VEQLLRELAEINANAQIRADYTKTLALLRALKAGTVSLDNLTMSADGWSVAAIEQTPAEKTREPEAT
jgi:phage gp36-like protein